MPVPQVVVKSVKEVSKAIIALSADTSPVLFNARKHHRGYLRELISNTKADITPQELRLLLLPIGAAQLDFYTGTLAAGDIMQQVQDYLQQKKLLTSATYKQWIQEHEGYRLLSLSDNSNWVLRLGLQPAKWVHLHPARYSLHTVRLKAHSLKTAIALSITAPEKSAEAARDLLLVNQLRGYLQLPPLSARQLAESKLAEIVTYFY